MDRHQYRSSGRSAEDLQSNDNRQRKRPRDGTEEEEARNRSRPRPETTAPPRKDDDVRSKSREELERERQERMARIRAENESEEAAAQQEPERQPTRNGAEQIIAVTFPQTEGEDDEEEEEELMQRLFGVSSFGSSKNTKVATNHASAAVGVAQKHKARKYRQYMNRKNGFNRPLDNV